MAPYANGQFVAMLAQSFRNVDPTTWEFTLRNNVKFAGGNALTADAIKWNFDRIANPDNKLQVAARILPQYERAEVVSPLVVRLKTKTPDPIWPRRCFQVLIADPAEAQRDTFTGNPGPNAGTGIFKLLEYAAQNSATLVANANSWRGQPRLQTFTFRQLPDPAALEAALKAGDLDLAQLTPDRADCMQQAGLNVDRVAQTNVYQLWFQTRQPPFNNKVARMAAAAAIDAQNIISSLYTGSGVVAS